MSEKNYDEIYYERFKEFSFADIIKEINAIDNPIEQEELRKCFCNDLLYFMTQGFTKYNPDADNEQFSNVRMFLENVEKLNRKRYFYWAVYYFYKKDNKKCIENIDLLLKESFESGTGKSLFIDEASFIDYFLEPYKNASNGFWKQILDLLEKYNCEQDIKDYCRLIDKFYTLESEDEVINELIGFNQKYPDFYSVLELLGYTYYEKKMWRNAIGFFEKTVKNERIILFPQTTVYFMLAWSYGSIKDYRQEENYLRKCAEFDRFSPFVLNNLGYCLYKQRKLAEAKAVFEECLENKLDLQYAANNYVRVLLALGRNKDAKAFIKKGDYRISKSLKERAQKAENSNARIKKDIVIEDDERENSIKNRDIDLGVKRQQFSSEKLLEDELTLRLESGMEIFGMKLRIYNHEGDFYGRQYPFEMGRLDLLCENESGDLYIIELKKDSGYDDAYSQTVKYLEWFEKAPVSKGKKVYGIICLNSPSTELIELVRKDKRIKLFEYQISYTEIC